RMLAHADLWGRLRSRRSIMSLAAPAKREATDRIAGLTVRSWLHGQEASMRHREAGSWHVRALTGLQATLIVAACMLFLANSAPSQGDRDRPSARLTFALIG